MTSARGEQRASAAWVQRRRACAPAGGCSGDRSRTNCRSAWARAYTIRSIDEPWCVLASEVTVPTRVQIQVLRQALGD